MWKDRKEEGKKKLDIKPRWCSVQSSALPHLLWAAEGTKRWKRIEAPVRGSLDLPSLGIKYCTQSKMKLVLSGLLNRSKEADSLFRSHTCDSNHCHTSNYRRFLFENVILIKRWGWNALEHLFFPKKRCSQPRCRFIWSHLILPPQKKVSFNTSWCHIQCGRTHPDRLPNIIQVG